MSNKYLFFSPLPPPRFWTFVGHQNTANPNWKNHPDVLWGCRRLLVCPAAFSRQSFSYSNVCWWASADATLGNTHAQTQTPCEGLKLASLAHSLLSGWHKLQTGFKKWRFLLWSEPQRFRLPWWNREEMIQLFASGISLTMRRKLASAAHIQCPAGREQPSLTSNPSQFDQWLLSHRPRVPVCNWRVKQLSLQQPNRSGVSGI